LSTNAARGEATHHGATTDGRQDGVERKINKKNNEKSQVARGASVLLLFFFADIFCRLFLSFAFFVVLKGGFALQP